MINNRQGGRRRGRGGQRGQNVGGPSGNRQDNRQRGNAAQLLEKYKSLARDSQLAGDRVQTEYYLQYADHYFRMLGENRPKFEDQRRQRGDESEDYEGEEELAEADGDSAGDDEAERQPQGRPQRPERGERFNRNEPRERQYSRDDRDDRGNRDNRGNEDDDDRGVSRLNGGDDSLPLDVLPPAIGADGPATIDVDEPLQAAPKRRTRTPRPRKTDDDVAPSA